MTIAIPDFSSARVLVAGDVMLDRYLVGATARISPEAPVPVVHVRSADARAGGAANVAANLARLGVATRLLGLVGDDDEAAVLRGAVKATGVQADFTTVRGWPTITKTRVQSRGQQLIRLDREEPLDAAPDALARGLAAAVGDVDVVVLSDYGKGGLGDVAGLIAICRDAGTPVYVDPKGTDFARYRGATLVTPNQAEFEAVAGRGGDDDDLVTRGRRMLDDLDLAALLITRSEKGMLLLERGDEPQFLATRAREVFDVTGAGDTAIAALAAASAAGQSLKSAAALANLAAGIVVGKIGTAAVTTSELRVALHRRGHGGHGLVDETDLRRLVEESHARGEKVIMTNGCFDVLHAGHVAYLEEAKSLGDRLVVAVNDDDSVRRLKGEKRPVNALLDRMEVLAGLAAVDWVVPFADDTPERLITGILPDVLVKGGDYRADRIAGAEAVLANGGEVRVLAFREGHSSSRIIDRLDE